MQNGVAFIRKPACACEAEVASSIWANIANLLCFERDPACAMRDQGDDIVLRSVVI
ncbi:hypothetical protein [Novosphingobium sp. PhB165]|uniref:hypothetical protein n=1 Tax=Novosphingobium sp. PhB165 TaxID=2485105 RepID=UPI0014045A3E|nr:hypothetical protein [Novosphingobium sp. PhB165]